MHAQIPNRAGQKAADVITIRTIVWDTDGKRVRLPKSVAYPADAVIAVGDFGIDPASSLDLDFLKWVVMNHLSDEYGWLIEDCDIEFPDSLLDALKIPRPARTAA